MTAQAPPLPPGMRDWLLDSVLKDAKAEQIRRAKAPLDLRTVFLDETGNPSREDPEETKQRAVAAYAFFVLLLTSIFTSSAYLLQGMAEEKENRVLEMVLSSVKPDQLMLGKLMGLGAAGLLQMTIWTTMSLIAVMYFAIQFVIAPATFAFCFTYYLLGYVLFGS